LLVVAGITGISAPCFSQQASQRDVQIHVGAIGGEAQIGVRSPWGATASIEVTQRLAHHLSLGPMLTIAIFPAPNEFISPAGCFGASPCIDPSPSVVRIATLGAIGGYTIESGGDIAAVLLAGMGMRYLTESPERSNDFRPYAEVGLGIVVLRRFVVRIRGQKSPPGSELPNWAVPMTVGVVF
jgi:hypothetical protein